MTAATRPQPAPEPHISTEPQGNHDLVPGETSLAAKARSGILWVTALNVFRDFLQFGTMLVLVRLLAPKAYGEFSLISSVMVFFTVFSFRSFLEHTLQLRPEEPVDYQSHFTAGAFLQIAMCALVNVAAYVLRHFAKYAGIAPVLHATSIFFLLDWAGEFRVKMLERALDWKRLRSLQAIGLAASSSLAIVLAKLGLGVYALVLPGMLATLPFIWDLFFRYGWRPDWTWSAAHYRAAWTYGWTRIMAGVLTTARPLIEGAAIVQVTGFTQLGFMSRAVGLAALCCQKLPGVLTMTLYPLLTRMARKSEAFERANGLVLRLVGWMAIPGAILFSRIAHPLVRLIYGSKWDAAIPLLPYALAGGTAGALYQASTMLMLADVQHRGCAAAEFLTLVGLTVCLVAALPHGISAYLGSAAVVQALVLAWMLWSLVRAGALSPSAIVRGVFAPAAASAAAWLACAAAPESNSALAIGGISLLFVASYGLGMRMLCPREFREFVHYLPLPARSR
ncbi:MAG TPA: oligosaccharide flippase family protein [Bryobacteraceae bacterium]|nr:oligosaccharide flippase family protein [Bryobacteraceae bacterium]